MTNDEVTSLRKAHELSPENIPLLVLYINALRNGGELNLAEKKCLEAMRENPDNPEIKKIYAMTSFDLDKTSQCIVVLEDIFSKNQGNPAMKLLYIKAIARQGDLQRAAVEYRNLIMENPGLADAQLEENFKVHNGPGANEVSADDPDDGGEEDNFSADFYTERPDTKFKDIGGMEKVKEQVRRKIILPLEQPEIFKAYGKKAGGGILLYGPPGCGKTHIARATAGEIKSTFMAVGLEDVLEMWLGESEKKLHHIFETARRKAPCVLFFDEIDALGGKRTGRSVGAQRTDINQFLSEFDGIKADNEGVLVLGATNMPWAMDPAFRRTGRFDRVIFVPPPDEKARVEILKIHCEGKPLGNVDFMKIAKKTQGYSGADLRGLIEAAVEEKIAGAISSGKIAKIETDDFIGALKEVKASTGEWLATARNHALYSNTDGIYDDILEYLELKK